MDGGAKFLSITAVIVLAVTLQVFLILTDRHESPAKAAVDFAKAYYKQDAAISERLCQDILTNEDQDVVAGYINQVADEAGTMGFAPSWMKMALGHIETETHMTGDDAAEVRIKASARRIINALYAVVARVFFLGETHHIDETVNLVKEDNQWKVCGEPLALPTS